MRFIQYTTDIEIDLNDILEEILEYLEENKKQFASGISIRPQATKYGEILKIGINLENFKNNPQNNGWVNFEILKSKEGKPYVVIDEFNSKKEDNSNDNDVPF